MIKEVASRVAGTQRLRLLEGDCIPCDALPPAAAYVSDAPHSLSGGAEVGLHCFDWLAVNLISQHTAPGCQTVAETLQASASITKLHAGATT
jgi:hypothetical protein